MSHKHQIEPIYQKALRIAEVLNPRLFAVWFWIQLFSGKMQPVHPACTSKVSLVRIIAFKKVKFSLESIRPSNVNIFNLDFLFLPTLVLANGWGSLWGSSWVRITVRIKFTQDKASSAPSQVTLPSLAIHTAISTFAISNLYSIYQSENRPMFIVQVWSTPRNPTAFIGVNYILRIPCFRCLS